MSSKLKYRDNTYFNEDEWYWMGGSSFFTVCKLKLVNGTWWTYHEWESGWNPYTPWTKQTTHESTSCKATSVHLVKVKELKGTKVCLKDHPKYKGTLNGAGVWNSVGVSWDGGPGLPGSVYYWNDPLKLIIR